MQLYADAYRFDMQLRENDGIQRKKLKDLYEIESRISTLSFSNRSYFRLSGIFSAETGIEVRRYTLSPLNTNTGNTVLTIKSDTENPMEANVFGELSYLLVPRQQLNAGLRLSSFGSDKKLHWALEPRLSYHGIFGQDFALSASAGRMRQYIHRIANPGVGVALEVFHPADRELKPAEAWSFSVGGAKDFHTKELNFSLKTDLWYKVMDGLVDFREGYDSYSIIQFRKHGKEAASNYLTQGKGYAYGLDLSVNFIKGSIKVFADYSLMQARQRFEELNKGRYFRSPNDIRHALSLQAELRLTKSSYLSANWQYRSGRPVTLPEAIYPSPSFDYETGKIEIPHPKHSESFMTMEDTRNNYTLPPFHKLDLVFNYRYRSRKKRQAQFSFGIYNLYNRANASYYFIDRQRKNGQSYPLLKSISLFPILPSFSWEIKF